MQLRTQLIGLSESVAVPPPLLPLLIPGWCGRAEVGTGEIRHRGLAIDSHNVQFVAHYGQRLP